MSQQQPEPEVGEILLPDTAEELLFYALKQIEVAKRFFPVSDAEHALQKAVINMGETILVVGSLIEFDVTGEELRGMLDEGQER